MVWIIRVLALITDFAELREEWKKEFHDLAKMGCMSDILTFCKMLE